MPLPQSSPCLRFPVSVTASLASVFSVSTKLGLERSTSKMTSGSVATRASVRGQTPRGGGLSSGARINGKAVPVPQTFHVLHPAASASSHFFTCWWGPTRCTTCNMETKQARVLAQSYQQQRHGRGRTWAPIQINSLQHFDLWKTLRQGQKGPLTESIVISQIEMKQRLFCSRADTSAMSPSSPIVR